jgi:hypothetical protein
MLLFHQIQANIDDILSLKAKKMNNKKLFLSNFTIRDAPSITFVNITIDFNLSSHIIRHRSSHVSGFGPKYIYIYIVCFKR